MDEIRWKAGEWLCRISGRGDGISRDGREMRNSGSKTWGVRGGVG